MLILRLKEAYCHSCNQEHPFYTEETGQEYVIHGLPVSIIEQRAYCRNCGGEVYVPEISDAIINKIQKVVKMRV